MTAADLRKLCVLLNNVAPVELVRLVYGPDASDEYIDVKASVLHADPVRWMSSLDGVNLARLADLANVQQR